MSPEQVLLRLRRRYGVRLTLDGDRIRAAGLERAPQSLREALGRQREWIIGALRAERRREAQRPLVDLLDHAWRVGVSLHLQGRMGHVRDSELVAPGIVAVPAGRLTGAVAQALRERSGEILELLHEAVDEADETIAHALDPASADAGDDGGGDAAAGGAAETPHAADPSQAVEWLEAALDSGRLEQVGALELAPGARAVDPPQLARQLARDLRRAPTGTRRQASALVWAARLRDAVEREEARDG